MLASPPTTRIMLRAESPWTELSVADRSRSTVVQGLGGLDAELEPGVYQLEYRAGDSVERQLVALEAGKDYVRDAIDVAMSCAAPIRGARNADRLHAEAAEVASAVLTASGARSGLVLMIRNVDGAAGPPTVDDVAVIRDGKALDLRVTTDPGGEWIVATLAAKRGVLLRGPRSKLPADLKPLLEQPLWLCDGWQTVVFVPNGPSGPGFADASVHLVPMSDGWHSDKLSASATEALLWRLRTPPRALSKATVAALACDIERAPMNAILLAHLLLRDGAKIDKLAARLQSVLPGHPDVRALTWIAKHKAKALSWPPMLRAGFERMQRLDTEEHGVLRDGSAAVKLASGQFREGLWTAFHPEGNIVANPSNAALSVVADQLRDPSTQRVLAHLDRVSEAGEGSDERDVLADADTARVAYLTSLPTAAVARALTDIEATLNAQDDQAALGSVCAQTPPPVTSAPGEAAPQPAPAPSAGDDADAEAPRPPREDGPQAAAEMTGPAATPPAGAWRRLEAERAIGAAPLEKRLSRLLRFLSVVSALAFVPLIARTTLDGGLDLPTLEGVLQPAVVAIITRSILLGALFALAASDVRRFGALVELLIWVLVVEAAALATLIATGHAAATLHGDTAALAYAWFAIDAAIIVAIGRLSRRAYRTRFGLQLLSPGNHRTLQALSETVHGAESVVPAARVAHNVDAYLHGVYLHDSRKLSLRRARLALNLVALVPILHARPSFSLIAPDDRPALLHGCWPGMRRVRASVLRTAHQLCSLGYYVNLEVAEEIGGPAATAAGGVVPVHTHPSLTTRGPDDGHRRHRVDAVVVGSGAAGALIAYRLAERGLHTIIVERGTEIDPGRDTSDALQTLPDLLGDGSLDVLGDLDARVHRMSTLGGDCPLRYPTWSSVAPMVVNQWVEEFGLDEQRFREAWQQVLAWLPGIDRPAGPFSRAAELLQEGIEQLGYTPTGTLTRPGEAPPDLSERSVAALDTLLPWGQRRFGDRLEVMPGCEVRRILMDDGEPSGVACRMGDGRELTIDAKTVVLAAGALGSAQLLRRSAISRTRGFSFNLASTLTADFEEQLDAHLGVQLLTDLCPDQPKFVVESTWSPVWLQSMAMPGTFDHHAANMRRYRHMAAMRVHLGTDRSGHAPYWPRRATQFSLTHQELARLGERLEVVGEILFAVGARRVMPATPVYQEFASVEQLRTLAPSLTSSRRLAISARPQGGAPMSRHPGGGVVDPDLRVHGCRNLYACDASIFPTSVTRRPHLTAMAMAEYCAMGME